MLGRQDSLNMIKDRDACHNIAWELISIVIFV